jgi:hypothetical protein
MQDLPAQHIWVLCSSVCTQLPAQCVVGAVGLQVLNTWVRASSCPPPVFSPANQLKETAGSLFSLREKAVWDPRLNHTDHRAPAHKLLVILAAQVPSLRMDLHQPENSVYMNM